MAAPKTRASHQKLQPKPKTESKSWQTRNSARKEHSLLDAASHRTSPGSRRIDDDLDQNKGRNIHYDE